MEFTNHRQTSCTSTYLHKGTGDGATPELVEQSFTDSHIRHTGHPVCDYNNACNNSENMRLLNKDKKLICHLQS